MNIFKNVVNKLSQEEKKEVNLASEKIELGSIQDLRQNVQDVEAFYKSVGQQFKKVGLERITLENLNKELKKEVNSLIKNMSSVEKQAQDLGLNVNDIDIYKAAKQNLQNAKSRIDSVDKFVK